MKLGVISDEVTQNIDKAILFAQKHGLDGIELRTIEDKNIDELTINETKEINKKIKDEGLEVCNISSLFFKCNMDDKYEYDENIDKLKRLIERAHIFECGSIRGFTFFRNGDFENNINQIIDKFQIPTDILKNESIKLLLESDPSVYTTNLKKLARILSSLDRNIYYAIYDPGNDIFDPDGEKPFPDGYNAVKNYIYHVHIKDAKYINNKPQAVKIGEGIVPYKDIFNKLLSDGYEGYLVLETHYRHNVEISDEQLRLPGGSNFSFNGYSATDESMVELKKLLYSI